LPVCEKCGVPATILMGGSALCTGCAAKTKGDNKRFADTLRFFDLLTLARSKNEFVMPSLPPDTTCNGCGLRFDEFSQIGKTGCAECYSAFEAAIGPALEFLHSSRPV
jgi:protein arginine kinase activator